MSDPHDPLMPVPIPALAALLMALEERKQRPLTRLEVIIARDHCHCVMLPLSQKRAMDEARGYADVDPENVWESWSQFLATHKGEEGAADSSASTLHDGDQFDGTMKR